MRCLKKVVLPHPEPPMMTVILPRGIWTLIPFSTVRSPKRLMRFLTSMTCGSDSLISSSRGQGVINDRRCQAVHNNDQHDRDHHRLRRSLPHRISAARHGKSLVTAHQSDQDTENKALKKA